MVFSFMRLHTIVMSKVGYNCKDPCYGLDTVLVSKACVLGVCLQVVVEHDGEWNLVTGDAILGGDSDNSHGAPWQVSREDCCKRLSVAHLGLWLPIDHGVTCYH